MGKNVFEQMAKKYDSDERRALTNVILTEVRTHLGDSQEKTLLDYGSGTGLVGLELTDLVKSVMLVDASEQMTNVSREKIAQSGISNAEAICSDFIKDTPQMKADIVLCSLVLLHIPETKKILQKIVDVLHDEGTLLIVDFDKNNAIDHPTVHNGFTKEYLQGLLTDVGLTPVSMETFYHGKEIFMKKDASMFLAKSVKQAR